MAIPKCILTKKGAALLAKTPKGAAVPVTRWQMGTGALPPEDSLDNLTQLVQPLKYLPISSITNSGQQSLVLGQFVNEGMNAFVWEELGLWAQDPDEGEILYAVGNARGEGDIIEAWEEKLREFTFGMELAFSGTANVTAQIDRTLIFAKLTDLDSKADKDPETGKLSADQLPALDLSGKADLDPETGKVHPEQLPAMGAWYRSFEVEQWSGGVLRVPKSEHGMTPVKRACMCQLRQRVARTALDYYGSSAALGRTSITNAMKAALNANTSAPGTYPTAADGHVQLTWNQVQYYILEGVLASDQTATAKASEKGFNWQDRETTGAPETATLDAVLTASYVPALGGSSAGLDALCTDKVLQGLRLRRKADNAGTVSRYDLDGMMTLAAWAVMDSQAYWDLETQDLVISGGTAFAGDLMVLP